MQAIHDYTVRCAPPTVYYIPNFITENEEGYLLNKVYSVPKPKWTCLSNRRLQDYGGVPHKNGMIVETIPSWLETYTDRITQLNIFDGKPANHVLINEYLSGQGIMAHTDGPLFYPTVTTISCGSHTVLEFCDPDKRENICDLLLEPRSLVILRDDMYSKHLHFITERIEDVINERCANLKECYNKYSVGQVLQRCTRVSLTIRNVPKVRKIKLWNL